jgi:hypothetical protein
MTLQTEEFGEIAIGDLPLPDGVRVLSAGYTFSGRVFAFYLTDDDPDVDDWYNVAVIDDDGRGFRRIFAGAIPQKATANGIRHMPFADDRRVLLGDYVLECTPDISTCESAQLIDVEYPWGIADDPLTTHHWSEIIIAPDDEHIAWTSLPADMTGLVGLGRLSRTTDKYVIEDASIISTVDAILPDPERRGFVVPQVLRGGEAKQFVHGGTAISFVGDGGGTLTDSVVQDIASGEVTRITRTPGYDETTMFSPDERLGIVMTSRESAPTDPAILGLVPRPHGNLIGVSLAWTVYVYTVAGVRAFRPGNVGPVLIDIERSVTDSAYRGVALNTDEEWVYCSPMSWHPHGDRVMWMETRRGSGGERVRDMRARIAHLLDHVPGAPVPAQVTPDAPYGIAGPAAENLLRHPSQTMSAGRIAGAHHGYLEFERRPVDESGRVVAHARYVDYSDDGIHVYDGIERVSSSMQDGTVYEADLEVTGETGGEMRLRLAWSGLGQGARLVRERNDDGMPASHGFARWGEAVLRVEDLAE